MRKTWLKGTVVMVGILACAGGGVAVAAQDGAVDTQAERAAVSAPADEPRVQAVGGASNWTQRYSALGAESAQSTSSGAKQQSSALSRKVSSGVVNVQISARDQHGQDVLCTSVIEEGSGIGAMACSTPDVALTHPTGTSIVNGQTRVVAGAVPDGITDVDVVTSTGVVSVPVEGNRYAAQVSGNLVDLRFGK